LIFFEVFDIFPDFCDFFEVFDIFRTVSNLLIFVKVLIFESL